MIRLIGSTSWLKGGGNQNQLFFYMTLEMDEIKYRSVTDSYSPEPNYPHQFVYLIIPNHNLPIRTNVFTPGNGRGMGLIKNTPLVKKASHYVWIIPFDVFT